MKGGDAHTLLSVGDMFRDPKTNHEYRIARIEEDDTYMVISKNEIIKRTKEFFEPLDYIGSYDFSTGKFKPVAANQEEDAIKQDKPSEENTVKVKVVVIVVKIKKLKCFCIYIINIKTTKAP
jgi:hypothetical protein